MAGLERVLITWLDCILDADTDGGSGDWTTFKDGESSSGGSGRKIRIGTLRNGCDGGGRRLFEMRWNEGRSTVHEFSQFCYQGGMVFFSCMNAHHFQRPSTGPMSPPWKDS